MKKLIYSAIALCCMALPLNVEAQQNTLTQKEIKEGWVLLFDGESLSDHWRRVGNPNEAPTRWCIKDGVASIQSTVDGKTIKGGTILTKEKYAAFEFSVDFKLTEAANSGIKYFVTEDMIDGKNLCLGLEYQLLDDAKHPDAKKFTEVEGSRTLASLYDMMPAAANKPFNGVGKWNTAVVKAYPSGKVEHYLNGKKVLEYVRLSNEFHALIAKSKYKGPSYNKGKYKFGEAPEGYIQLQDHSDQIYFRNIKIRRL